jgi:hypothetical protein
MFIASVPVDEGLGHVEVALEGEDDGRREGVEVPEAAKLGTFWICETLDARNFCMEMSITQPQVKESSRII